MAAARAPPASAVPTSSNGEDDDANPAHRCEPQRLVQAALAVTLLATLVACGGGGESGGKFVDHAERRFVARQSDPAANRRNASNTVPITVGRA